MFVLITGAPGSGKTLYLMNALKDGVKYPKPAKDDFEALNSYDPKKNRPVYYFGIPEVSPDLNWTIIKDPFNWHDEVPTGSIVVIDEVQEHFPVRPAKNPVPLGLKALERHRHKGLDIYFMTQHPSLLDHHARRLVNEHIHLKRNFGAPFSAMYRSNECMQDPQDYHTLQKADQSTFKYPKSTYGLYKSSEIHTHKFKIPKKLYILIPLIFGVIYAIYSLSTGLLSDGNDPPTSTGKKNGVTDSLYSNISPSKKNKTKITIESFIPQINNIPATSPIYVSKWQVRDVPIVSSCIGTKTICKCYSQQASLVIVTQAYCISILENGLNFDHTYIDKRRRKQDKGKKK